MDLVIKLIGVGLAVLFIGWVSAVVSDKLKRSVRQSDD
jgi:hypothetical protein